MSNMSEQMDELVEKATAAYWDVRDANSASTSMRAALEAVGLPAVLERVEAAEGDTPSGFWSQREWEDWSNELAMLIPEDDDSKYANPEGAQESIILDCFKAYVAERDALAAKVADAGERIAVAIEAYLDPSDCDNDPTCEQCALVRQLAAIARAALTEGTEG